MSSSETTSTPKGGIDASAWTAGISYFAGATVISVASPAPTPFYLRPEAFALLAGIVFFFASVVVIQRHMDLSLKSTGFGEPQKLVRSWVFARSRNPIYVAFLVPLAAMAVFSVAAALVGIAVYVGIMNRFVIRREERDLERLFGQDYLDYKAATPRWLF